MCDLARRTQRPAGQKSPTVESRIKGHDVRRPLHFWKRLRRRGGTFRDSGLTELLDDIVYSRPRLLDEPSGAGFESPVVELGHTCKPRDQVKFSIRLTLRPDDQAYLREAGHRFIGSDGRSIVPEARVGCLAVTAHAFFIKNKKWIAPIESTCMLDVRVEPANPSSDHIATIGIFRLVDTPEKCRVRLSCGCALELSNNLLHVGCPPDQVVFAQYPDALTDRAPILLCARYGELGNSADTAEHIFVVRLEGIHQDHGACCPLDIRRGTEVADHETGQARTEFFRQLPAKHLDDRHHFRQLRTGMLDNQSLLSGVPDETIPQSFRIEAHVLCKTLSDREPHSIRRENERPVFAESKMHGGDQRMGFSGLDEPGAGTIDDTGKPLAK